MPRVPMQKTVLVAGGAGFVGSHLCDALLARGDRVICIDNGSIIFDLPREDITDRAGIAHCTQAQAAELMACVEGSRAAHHAGPS